MKVDCFQTIQFNLTSKFIFVWRMRAVQTKEATSQMRRDGTHHLQNLPEFAGKKYFTYVLVI